MNESEYYERAAKTQSNMQRLINEPRELELIEHRKIVEASKTWLREHEEDIKLWRGNVQALL